MRHQEPDENDEDVEPEGDGAEHEVHGEGEAPDEDEADEPGQADHPGPKADVYDKLSHLSRRIGRQYDLDEDEAKDLGQEVNVSLFKSKGAELASSEFEKIASLGSKTARRRALNYIRDSKRLSARLEEYETERSWAKNYEDDPLAQLEVNEAFEIAGRTLNLMTKRQREICLRRMDGLSHVAVAAELGITPSAVDKTWEIAWERLSAALIDYME